MSTAPDAAEETATPMIRRSFRIGLTLGTLAGGVAAVVKAVQARRSPAPSAPAAPSWPPLPAEPPAPAPAGATAPGVTSGVGAAADDLAGDVERQPDTPTPDWASAATDAAEAPSPVTGRPEPPPAPKKQAPRSATKRAAAPSTKDARAGSDAAAAEKAARKKPAPARPWVEPDADGACPASHPVKANLRTKIFHLPGGLSYDRTRPDRCYVDAGAAEADELRAAKR